MNEVLEDKTPEDRNLGIINPYKKGDNKECRNYRGITLTSTMSKMYARILEKRVREKVEHTLEETQFGFRSNRGTADAMFIMRQLEEKP